MKLIVNIDCLIPPLTGVGRYAQGILRELARHPDVIDLRAFSSLGQYDRQALMRILDAPEGLLQTGNAHSNIQGNSTQTAIAVSTPPKPSLPLRVFQAVRPWLAKVPGLRALRRALRTYSLNRATRALRDYIYWEPNYLLMPYNGQSVAVVYDLSHLRYPQHHPQSRLAELGERLPATMSQATRIVTISEFTRDEIAHYFPDNRDVGIVYPGVDDAFFNVTPADVARIAERYQLPARYVLSVATLEPRKNLQSLLKAWLGLPENVQASNPLVLAGHKGWLSDALADQMNALEAKGLIRYLGYVPQQDMAALVAGATVLAYVSLYEGFGMPVAEAMAAGTAVLTSTVASMPEVAGSAACLVDPHNVDDIRQGLQRLLEDDAFRADCEQRGPAQARQFTWASSTQALVDFLKPLAQAGASK